MMTVYLSVPYPNYLAAMKLIGVGIAEDAEIADALLLPGGGDIHPKHYGQTICEAKDIDEMRDANEFSLVQRFAQTKRPIFGICRGLQLINAAFGGTLYQHFDGHSQIDGTDRLHTVQNTDILRTLYGQHCTVNSAHHQSVNRLGENLHVLQRAGDGVIEAICHDSLPIFAVQWHPERLCGEFVRNDAADGLLLLRDFFLKW